MEVFPAEDTEKMRAHLRGMQRKVAELEKICQRKEREMKRERERMKRERMKRERWQPRGGGKNKKCHLSGNAEVVPISEPSKKVVPVSDNYPKCRATI